MSNLVKRQKRNKLVFSNKYYPNPIKYKKLVKRYLGHDDLKPYNILETKIDSTEIKRKQISVGECVVHLFNRDLRLKDNRSLIKASELALENNVPLICLYIICDEEVMAHNTSPFQLAYRMESLKELKSNLKELNIPLICSNVNKISEINLEIIQFMKKYKSSHLYSNIEYEVDELNLFTSLLDDLGNQNFSFNPIHNSCIVPPGKLKSKSKNTPYSVFSPWFKSWKAYIQNNLPLLVKSSKVNPNSKDMVNEKFEKLFYNKLPELPKSKVLTVSQKEVFENNYKCGENSAWESLKEFINSGRISSYMDTRNNLDQNGSSNMSMHISSGTISTAAILNYLFKVGKLNNKLEGGIGVNEWVRQLAWRDFYKNIICEWPYVCMFRPFKLDYCDLNWDNKEQDFNHWCNGTTGYPIIDAAMRQLNEVGYMTNRCRMIVASFLSKHLLIDWRFGEQYFMEKLIDADFASNNGGWQFCASTGADPQPYFRIFNPLLQSKKFDKKGNYIKKWIPELRSIDDENAIHEPYNSKFASVALKNKYPNQIVIHSEARKKALLRYEEARVGD